MQEKSSSKMIQLFNIYVPMNYQEKIICWDSLHAFRDPFPLDHRSLASELNKMISSEEKIEVFIHEPIKELVDDLIFFGDLFNPWKKMSKYTWETASWVQVILHKIWTSFYFQSPSF